MPDSLTRAADYRWRVLAAAGAAALVLGGAVAATGGVDWVAGPLHFRARQPWRLLGAGALLIGAAAWLGGRRFKAALEQAWDARDRRAAWFAAAAAIAAAAVGLAKGTWVAGSADSYGYVSQALLWLKGLPIQLEPLVETVPWPLAEWSLSPLGYKPGIEAGVIVPTYPPGLPLAMAAAASIGGAGAVFCVVPVLGAGAVWLTYLLGRRYANDASGAAAAVLLAASPVFLYQVVQPMSDVPVTAWWLLSAWGAGSRRPLVSGAGAAAAVLTRPNLAPVAVVILAAVLVHGYSPTRTLRSALRAAILFAIPPGAAAAFLAWLNTRFYGSPFASGYGPASDLFAFGNIVPNAVTYMRWLVETQTPVVLVGLAAPVVAGWSSRRSSGSLAPGHAWFGLAFASVVVACYLPYSTFGDWWYLRFLLPLIPVLLVLTTPVFVRAAALAPAALRAPMLAATVGLLAAYCVSVAVERDAFALQRLESRYAAAGAFAAGRLPANAALLSVQESGPLRMYGGRTTVRFDYIDPQGLDAAVRFLARAGYTPYFALEAWEEVQFRERFSRHSALGLLDWPPAAEVGVPVKVRFYDPRDRQRFLDGVPVATSRDSTGAPRRR